ncbi:ABC transporter ATP-binding protein [Roseomonas sp. OT10]|uniref:ABC transporter ATP-binding protein n=1 Tax=Roseomonas cutis TaxID=2897332 RepID=UPI001E5CB31D|nr:ABC transporter ATP-binding protein [Roseomonas sp. OT10]UFN51122.1 ABC transporter ATP-binding protein [Roseomonas sp. OT10]
MPDLSLQHLIKRYGAQTAVDDLSLDVAEGECIALLGPSGCGKTTTLRMVAGYITPDSGHVRLGGRAIERDPPHKRNIGMVFQAYALFPHMTAGGNVAFGLETRGLGRAERDRRATAALAMVGLDGYADRYPAQMSGGQQQRVALARALVIEPDLLLLDEPLSNLDAGRRAEMRAEIARLRRRVPVTTLFVTHDQEEALALSDRVAVMQAGRLVELADPKTLSEHPARLFTAGFLGARTVLPGHAEAGRFVTAAGPVASLPDDAPPSPTHLVLRAARLRLAPAATEAVDALFATEGTVAEAAWLGDSVSYEIAAGEARLRVLRPTTEPAFPPGAPVRVFAGPGAVAFLSESGENR